MRLYSGAPRVLAAGGRGCRGRFRRAGGGRRGAASIRAFRPGCHGRGTRTGAPRVGRKPGRRQARCGLPRLPRRPGLPAGGGTLPARAERANPLVQGGGRRLTGQDRAAGQAGAGAARPPRSHPAAQAARDARERLACAPFLEGRRGPQRETGRLPHLPQRAAGGPGAAPRRRGPRPRARDALQVHGRGDRHGRDT